METGEQQGPSGGERFLNAPRVMIVVPCYNEGDRLPSEAFRRFIAGNDFHFVFVDDGCRDNTAERIENLRTGMEERVHLIRAVQNQGKAEAVRTGMNFALNRNAHFIGFFDADLVTPLNAITRFMAVFDE